MTKLPVLSGRELCKALARIRYEIDHQTGSHIILRKQDPPHRRLTVPNHKEIAKGTLRALLRQAGLTNEELLELLSLMGIREAGRRDIQASVAGASQDYVDGVREGFSDRFERLDGALHASREIHNQRTAPDTRHAP